MAYAENKVMPVVSDFDTFLVGSRGLQYTATPPEQVALMNWALDQTATLLSSPGQKGWMGRWLGVLKDAARDGFHPQLPKYGFGDATSYALIGDIVDATAVCGAVRHGAECFNCTRRAQGEARAKQRASERKGGGGRGKERMLACGSPQHEHALSRALS